MDFLSRRTLRGDRLGGKLGGDLSSFETRIFCKDRKLLSSPVSKPLVPQPPTQFKNPISPKGLGLTLKSCRPPTTNNHHPITFKHEGEVPHKNPKSKTDLEWSPQPIQHKKFQVDDDREYMGQSNMSKENIINLSSFNQYSILSSSGSLWLSLLLSLLHSLTPKLNLT